MFHSWKSVDMKIQEQLQERDGIRDARYVQNAEMHVQRASDGTANAEPARPSIDRVKRDFLERTYRSILAASRHAGISEEQAARRAGLSNPISEAVQRGSLERLTIEQYVDLALACGFMPLDLTLAPAVEAQEFAAEVPLEARSAPAFDAWLARRGVRRAIAAAQRAAQKR